MGWIILCVALTGLLWILAGWKPRIGMALGGLVIAAAVVAFVVVWLSPTPTHGDTSFRPLFVIITFFASAATAAIGVVAVLIAGVRHLIDDRRDDADDLG